MATGRHPQLTLHCALVALLLFAVLPAAFSQGDGSEATVQIGQEQARRGASVYAQHCAACHGEELEGFGPFPPVSGGGFRERWQGKTLGELYAFVSELMPLGAGGSLEPSVYEDVVAFLLQRNRVVPGEVEFDHEDELMLEAFLTWD
ncbi:MAG: cytochrome c [Trueperaceae bacterium]|nr:cytochrome c [Trueperaceae bacterium]